jgi:DNA-binding beta-propeller fold protein YncE
MKPVRAFDARGALIGALSLAALLPCAAAAQSRNALMYIGTYDNAITVVDEASGRAAGRITLKTGIPRTMTLSQDRSRFYVVDISYENVEVVDIASRTTLDTFTLSKGNEKVRIAGQAIDPLDRYGVFVATSYRKLADRFEVSEPMLLKVDLKTHQVTDTIKWPGGQVLQNPRMIFSPDGGLLYFFSDAIIVLETTGFTEVDRWDYEEALDPGLGPFNFGFPTQMYEQPGVFTGLFTLADPVQRRRILGIARVRLAERDVEFFTLGPVETFSLAVAPGGRMAYGVHSEVGDWQLWTFDLEGKRVVRRERFDGRPRMAMITSSDGAQLYIYQAGNTIDVYDAATYRHLRTITLDADTTTNLFVLPRNAGQD